MTIGVNINIATDLKKYIGLCEKEILFLFESAVGRYPSENAKYLNQS